MKSYIKALPLFVTLFLAPPVNAQYAMGTSHQWGETNYQKCGWVALTNLCPPLVRHYLQQECIESKDVLWTNTAGYFTHGEFTCDGICIYTGMLQNACQVIQTNEFGTCSYSSDYGWSASGSADLTNGWTVIGSYPDSPLTTNNYSTWCGPLDVWASGVDKIDGLGTGLDALDSDQYCLVLWQTGPWGTGRPFWDYSTVTTELSENSYTTHFDLYSQDGGETLLGQATNKVILSQEDPTSRLLNGFNTQTNWVDGLGVAFLSVSNNQAGVNMYGVRTKVKVNVPKGHQFAIPYVLHGHLDGISDTNSINPGAVMAEADYYQTNDIIGEGEGVPRYYPSGKGLFLRPPYGKVYNGCSDLYFGGAVAIELQGWISIWDEKDKPCNKSTLGCPSCSSDDAGDAGLDASSEASEPEANKSSKNSIPAGMPTWWVSEPYINLWAVDKPVEYTTSLGEQIAFTITYKQRDTRPALINGEKPYLAINGWNNNWYSYVHFIGAVATNEDGSFNCNDFTNWTATVYEPNGGESSFVASQSPDATSGDQLFALHGVDGNVFTDGFRLVHSDGSQDVYGRVTPMYPTNYLKLVTIYQDAADATAISAIWGSDGISYGGSSYEDITPEAIGNGGTLTFGTPANPATNYYSKISTWTNVMHSVTNYAVVSVPAGPSADALLTERIDPQGNALHFVYAITSGAYQLQSMVDYDGRTTTISYDTNGYITSVNMPYSRTATFQYAANTNAQLLNVTDAQGMSSSFTYTETFLNGMMTPYGTNRFTYYEAKDQSVTKPLEGLTRSLRVTRPDGAGEMYAFFASATNGTPFSYPTNQLPTPPTGVVLDNGVVGSPMSAMYRRNSYHWGPNQYELMSVHNPASLGQLNAYDFQLGRMRHWKMNDDGVTISSALSMEQAPSPDGSTAGLRTWYGGSWQGGDDEKPKYQMKLTPDGGTWTRSLAYHDQSDLLSYVSTSITDQSGNLSERYISYEYKNWNYSEVFSGQTFTWHGSWLSGISGPGFSTSINNDPDPLFVADSHPYSVSGYYPHYSEMHITDITGAHSTNYFNDRSQLTGRLLPTGLSTTILYGTDGFPSQSTAAEISAVNSYTFTNGLLASRTDPNGLLTTYSWDKLDRLTAVNYPDGTSLNYGYDKLDLTGHKDRLGYWATSSFDNMSRLTSVTDRNGKTTAYGRCTCGAITSITDPQTNTTTFDRNLVGWVNSMTFSGSTGSPTTRTFQRDSWGRATNITDDAGFNLNYSYNIQGLVTNVTSSQGIVYAATYDSADRPLTVCNSDGIWVTNAYDGAERLTDQTSAHGLSRHTTYSGWLRTATTDGFGNSIYFGYDPAGRLIATADTAFYHTNGFSYNPAGQMIALADGNGHVTQWDYDVYGRMIRKMDGNGVLVETNGYDSNGRVTARWTPAKELTHYSYDSNANLLSIAYNSGAGVTATYDGLNRVLTMSDAVGSSVFTYNGFGAFMGALATEDGPWASDTITHIYASRVPQSLTLGQPSGSWSETFGYDSLLRLQGLTSPAGNFTYNYSGAGRLVHGLTMPGSTSIANSFDDAGQLLSTALNHGGTLDSYAYAYDHNGNRLSVQRANNSVVNYGYDNLGQLTSALGLEPDGVTVRANENFGYGYDAAGNLAFRTNNTLAQVFITDPANQLMAVTRNNDLLTVAGSLSFAPTNLTVNGIGATIYQDLTFAVTNGVNIANGVNYLTNVVNGMLTNVARERLPVTVSQRYDQNGNLVWDGMKAFEYDCANELTRVTVTNGWQTEYAYDGFGRRRVKREYNWTGTAWSQTNEVHYVYDGMSVIQERDGSNNPKVTYTRGLDLSGTMQGAGGIGGLLARTDGSGSAYYHCDGNGNITMLTDASGNVLAKYLYDSFGNTLGMWGPLAATNTYRFSSKEIDARYGIYYYGYRYYEPNQQRWLNRDPIKEKGGINLYRMVGDNLVNQIDPLGLYNPISGSSGAVGAGSGLADPSLFLPPQLQPPSNNSSTSGGSGGYNSMLPLLVGGMSQAEKDYWSWKSIYDSQKDMLKRLPQDLKSPNKCADLTRTIDRMEALDGLPEAADGMGEATSAAIGETVGGAALGTAATVGFIVGGPIAAYYIGQNEADFYGGLLYSLCPTCF